MIHSSTNAEATSHTIYCAKYSQIGYMRNNGHWNYSVSKTIAFISQMLGYLFEFARHLFEFVRICLIPWRIAHLISHHIAICCARFFAVVVLMVPIAWVTARAAFYGHQQTNEIFFNSFMNEAPAVCFYNSSSFNSSWLQPKVTAQQISIYFNFSQTAFVHYFFLALFRRAASRKKLYF